MDKNDDKVSLIDSEVDRVSFIGSEVQEVKTASGKRLEETFYFTLNNEKPPMDKKEYCNEKTTVDKKKNDTDELIDDIILSTRELKVSSDEYHDRLRRRLRQRHNHDDDDDTKDYLDDCDDDDEIHTISHAMKALEVIIERHLDSCNYKHGSFKIQNIERLCRNIKDSMKLYKRMNHRLNKENRKLMMLAKNRK